MGNLEPIAFDIETSGLDADDVISVAGLAHELGEILILNTAGRDADAVGLERSLRDHSAGEVRLSAVATETELLTVLADVVDERLDEERHYLTAYHGEVWNGGFDLPFVRTACVRHDVPWPFPNLAYADVSDAVSRFNTNEHSDLVSVYNQLRGNDTCDPFDDSAAAVDAFEDGDWESLLCHNLADIQRTRELAVLARAYVPQSDFRMKNLDPPRM